MYNERDLTVEQIGQVLSVSRTSIYRAPGQTETPAPPGKPVEQAPSTPTTTPVTISRPP